MADTTLGFQFQDLILRVAEYLGVAYYGPNGDQAAQVPVDAHDLDLCKRLVNDGYRRFLNESPLWRFLTVPTSLQFVQTYTGTITSVTNPTTVIDTSRTEPDNTFNGYGMYLTHNTASGAVDVYTVVSWTLSTHTFVLTQQTQGSTPPANLNPIALDGYEMAAPSAVEGQSFRYYMPDDFIGLESPPFTYDVGGPRIQINPVDEHRIRELRVGANTSGTASVVAYRAINTSAASSGKRWEAMFWPRPTGNNRVTTIYRRYPQAFSNLTDRSVAGPQHDDAVIAATIAAAELQRNDTAGPREASYAMALNRSKKLDSRTASSKVSDYGDRSEDRGVGGQRPLNYYSVGTYGGRSIDGV